MTAAVMEVASVCVPGQPAAPAGADALGKKAGPEDDRTTSQRHHDGLEEACQRPIRS
jgi:hypothetical protein